MAWEEVVANILYFVIGTGLFTWLIKSLVTNYLDKDVEKFKKELQMEFFRSSTLHTDRATVIRELYSKLVDYDLEMDVLTCPLQFGKPGEDEKVREKKQMIKAFEAGRECYIFYLKNRIYFSSEICELLDKILTKYHHARIGMETKHLFDDKDQTERWMKSWDTVKKDIPPLKEELEEEFRSILGVEEE